MKFGAPRLVRLVQLFVFRRIRSTPETNPVDTDRLEHHRSVVRRVWQQPTLCAVGRTRSPVPNSPDPPDEATDDPPDASLSIWDLNVYRLQRPLGYIQDLALANEALTVPRSVIGPDVATADLPCVDLRPILLRGRVPVQVKDNVWRYLIAQAQAEKGDWNVYAIGAAFPGLIKRSGKLTEGKTRGQKIYTEISVMIEFLDAIHHPTSLDRPWVLSRLVGKAYDRVSGRKRVKDEQLDLHAVSIEGTLGGDLPDTTTLATDEIAEAELEAAIDEREVLDRLIRDTSGAGDGLRLTERHRDLITRTYLGKEPLSDVSASLGMTLSNASKQRRRAEMIIAWELRRPGLLLDALKEPPTSDEQTAA